MDMITEWVTQIIIFILLATIIDLLIPQNAFKKYIHLVVGLILILIFLKPVFYVFNMDIEQALDASYRELEQTEERVAKSEKKGEFQKKEIQASQDAYILEQMTAKLKELANPSLEKELDLEITDISYDFAKGEDKTLETMQHLIVYVQPSSQGGDNVERVDDVVINAKQKDNPEHKIPNNKIETILKNKWELKTGAQQLEIEWGGGIQ